MKMQNCLQAAVSFRDAGLFSVFQLALTALRQLTAPGQQADFKLQDQVHLLNIFFANLSAPHACTVSCTTAERRDSRLLSTWRHATLSEWSRSRIMPS
jgi:hypothetical protein